MCMKTNAQIIELAEGKLDKTLLCGATALNPIKRKNGKGLDITELKGVTKLHFKKKNVLAGVTKNSYILSN